MVFVLNERKARRIFEKYSNVAAFTLGKTKGINDDTLVISYEKLNFMPDDDTINGVIHGDIKAKKVIDKAVKALHNPATDDQAKINLSLGMAQLVNILYPETLGGSKKEREKAEKKQHKIGPNIIVFVVDDNVDNDPLVKARTKFLVKFVNAMFGEFGIETISDSSVVKHVFKGKKKKVIKNVAKFIENNSKIRISGKGRELKKILLTTYALELRQSALSAMPVDDISKNQAQNMIKTLLNIYTNTNLSVCGDSMKKKDRRDFMKKLRNKNRMACDAYESFAEIMGEITDKKMPKVKNGYKKGKDKVKMNTEKFGNFFMKKSRLPVLRMLYAHTTSIILGLEIGSKEYNKIVSNPNNFYNNDDSAFVKSFIAAAKTYGQPTKA